MCRGAPTLGPLRGSRPGAEPLVSSALDAFASLQPVHAHPYLQHSSEASAIEDALARAQAEAAMWRASFEKAQKVAQETKERYSVLVNKVTRAESVKPASMLTVLPEAFSHTPQSSSAPKEEGGLVTSLQTMRSEDPWMSLSGGETRDQPQSSTNKQDQDSRTCIVFPLFQALLDFPCPSASLSAPLAFLPTNLILSLLLAQSQTLLSCYGNNPPFSSASVSPSPLL
eukprot:TRINITY_DN4726_c0_g1_i1.p1 TRINITY_DN4726_c0_g1~~TRINITY_DN4726_c0_g1_i1.p1  ORF type:complete len:227 (+),score=48.33 TRINITY_DN4726_c0_g1_i1:534-1214(+)